MAGNEDNGFNWTGAIVGAVVALPLTPVVITFATSGGILFPAYSLLYCSISSACGFMIGSGCYNHNQEQYNRHFQENMDHHKRMSETHRAIPGSTHRSPHKPYLQAYQFL